MSASRCSEGAIATYHGEDYNGTVGANDNFDTLSYTLSYTSIWFDPQEHHAPVLECKGQVPCELKQSGIGADISWDGDLCREADIDSDLVILGLRQAVCKGNYLTRLAKYIQIQVIEVEVGFPIPKPLASGNS